MSSKKRSLESKESMNIGQAVEYLQQVADNLKSGEVRFAHGGEEISLTPTSVVSVKTSVKDKSDKTSLTVKISWAPEQPQLQAKSVESESVETETSG